MKLDTAAAYIKHQLQTGLLSHLDIARIVERAQLAMGLEADGMPGPVTIARLDSFMVESELTPVRGVPILPPVLTVEARRARAVKRMLEAYAWQEEQRGKGVDVGYGMGKGGKNPKAPHPFEEVSPGVWRCDCSGAVDWAWELEREPVKGIWLNTDRLEADARGQVKHDLGYEVPWEQALAGDVVVYGAGPLVGHTGLFTKDGAREVYHCHGNPNGGISIDVRPAWWRVTKHAVVLRMR